MASKLAPSNPADVMVVRDLTPNVVTLSVPFSRFASLKVGGRATLVKLTSGSLLVFSPVALTDEVKAKVASMGGELAYIVAPDMEHHLFVSEWKAFYPAARILGPAGLPEKRAGQKSDKVNPKDEFSYVFEAKTKHSISISPEFDADFDVEFVDGHLNKEVVLFYKPDRVVIEADLLFNLPAKEQYSRVPEEERESPSLAGRIFSGFQTTEGDLKWARRFHWHLAAKDRESFNKSIKRIADWDFVTMVPCHGDTMEGDAKERFLRVFEWHLAGQKGGAKK